MSSNWDFDLPTAPPVAGDQTASHRAAWTPPDPPPPYPASSPPPRPSGRRRGGWRAVIVLSVVGAVLGAGFLVGRLTTADDSTPEASQALDQEDLAEAGLPTTPPIQGEEVEPVAAVAGAVAPAVVQIETGSGLGSGIVYDPSGLILTNAHVIGDASEVTVTMGDGSVVGGQVLGSDPNVDIAVVEIEPDAVLEVAVLAMGEDPSVGQMAVALGSPFGLDQTVTAGIISAVDRPYPSSEIVVGMIQTDAAINTGNSGGALADRQGRVIGVNTAIFSNSGDNSGIGFAIPIDLAYAQATKIVNGEPLDLPFLGVEQGEDPAGRPGAYIASVTDDSAAAESGLQAGDLIVGIGAEDIKDFGDLAAEIGSYSPGETVELEIRRSDETITLSATLRAR